MSVPASLRKLGWYWHRLHAMNAREVLLRLEKKAHQRADRKFTAPAVALDQLGSFPQLPEKSCAPSELRSVLALEVEEILGGRWKAFGHLPLTVTDPPRWQADNLVSKDLQSSTLAFKLDHRAQPGGADIKILWEPSRWSQLVRLAMAAWLLDHSGAEEKCVEWLHHWAAANPPFTGLNWSSGLETGIRLIQFSWIDAFLCAVGVPAKTVNELRGRIVPPHVWYTWRYKSFGSSANNHLIGELAGLIIAQARWPELARISAPLAQIGALLDREILAQFAKDGGNEEQALGYHLFSWEFCFQAQRALQSAGAPLSEKAQARLVAAGRFYRSIKVEGDPWDFGDSDNAWVTPLFRDEKEAAREWWRWFNASSPVLNYWWGSFEPSSAVVREQGNWEVFPDSGYAVLRTADWFVRFDFSALGYLSMAPHGHLDALHLSVCFRGQPIIIDPGTGAYYADKSVRNYLASWVAHNGPHLKDPPVDYPKRFGAFLWGAHHHRPLFHHESPFCVRAEVRLPYGQAERSVTWVPDRNAILVQDRFTRTSSGHPVVTRWKFSPALTLDHLSNNEFRIGPVKLTAPHWKMAKTYNPSDELRRKIAPTLSGLGEVPLDSLVSPAFRALSVAPYLALESAGEGPFELLISPE